VPRKNAPPSRAELEELMKKHKGNQTAIAAELNKPVGTVYSLMSRNNLSSDDFKP
jgi:IS30 family transposase